MERVLLTLMVLGIAFSLVSECCGGETKKPVGNADYGGYLPHYQGFGINTPGGRGGKILRVTNLNDNGPGSLRAALEAEGPRIVIFEVSGTIDLRARITIAHPYITVAGQTAPSPGITIRYHPIWIQTHDVVIQHIRSRPGSIPQGNEGFAVRVISTWEDPDNVVLDHVSMSWGTADTLCMTNFRRTAVLDCIMAYTPNVNNLDWTGKTALFNFAPDGELTFARNLLVHNSNRSPWTGVGIRASLLNNVIYGSGNSGGDPRTQYGFIQVMGGGGPEYRDSIWKTEVAVQNNRIISSEGTGSIGPPDTRGTHPATKAIDVGLIDECPATKESRMYLSGNVGPHMTLDNQWGGVDFIWGYGNKTLMDYVTEPSWNSAFSFDLISPENSTSHVFSNVGARPLDRDAVDIRAVSESKAGLIHDLPNMGSRIHHQDEMGGWPALAENIRTLQVPENPHAVAPGQKFRTNIEMWLEKYARDLEPAYGGKATLAVQGAHTSTTPAAARVSEDHVTLAAAPASVFRREKITVSCQGRAHASSTDWLGLFTVGADDREAIDWRYTGSGNKVEGEKAKPDASFDFALPTLGRYEFRLFADNSLTRLATSNPVTVAPDYTVSGPVQFTASVVNAAPGSPVEVTHKNVPDTDVRAWIGLFPPEVANNIYVSWQWTNGKADGTYTFTMPSEPGVYEFRLIRGGDDVLAYSQPITVSISDK